MFIPNTISEEKLNIAHVVELLKIYTVSKNDTDVAHYNFNAHQPILVIFGRRVAKRACYRMVIPRN